MEDEEMRLSRRGKKKAANPRQQTLPDCGDAGREREKKNGNVGIFPGIFIGATVRYGLR